MASDDDSDQRTSAGDRRLLPRDEPGRRQEDARDQSLLTDEDESRLRLGRSTTNYVLLVAAVLVIGAVGVRAANTALAPMLHDQSRISYAAQGLGLGRAYLTYDLNIETRQLREEHVRRLRRTPELVVLGASHWQEGHAWIAPGVDFYNAHVHRDYYEDILGVTDAFVDTGRLPPKMIITIRDMTFLPVEARTDFLWVPGLPAYRRMAERLGLPYHNAYAHGLTPQLRQELSLPLLGANIERRLAAPIAPRLTGDEAPTEAHPTLSTLLPDGSVLWSQVQRESFTPERTRRLALELAADKAELLLPIDPLGVRSVDALIGYLVSQGVEVELAHPPFNPVVWDAVQGTAYIERLEAVLGVTRDLADKYGLRIIGSFDPYDVGCAEEMYIDGEHSGPECLRAIIAQSLDDNSGSVSADGNGGGVQ